MIHVATFNDPVAFDTFFRWARLLGLHFAYQNHERIFATVVTARPRFVWPCRVVALLARLHVWQRHTRRKMTLGKIAIIVLVMMGAWMGPQAVLSASGTIPDAASEAFWFNGRVCEVPELTHSCTGYTATPLAGVTVLVWDAAAGPAAPVTQVTTNAAGEFYLSGVFPANGRMMAGAYLPGEFRRVTTGWPTWPAFYYDFRYVPAASGASAPVRVFLPLMAIDSAVR